jgi:hypothetical protein
VYIGPVIAKGESQNKYLMMSAAAALAISVAGEADAGEVSVHFGTASGVSYCDGEIGPSSYISHVAVGEHIFSPCGSTYTNLTTPGFDSKGDKGIPGAGKGKKAGTISLSDTTFASHYHENYAIMYQMESPVAAGGKWDLWAAFSPTSAFLGNDGVLLAGTFKGDCKKTKCQTTVAKLLGAVQRR